MVEHFGEGGVVGALVTLGEEQHAAVGGLGLVDGALALGAADVDVLRFMPEDLVKFGLIPEFVGRLPLVVQLGDLDEEALVRILTEPQGAIIKQYQALFGFQGVDLEFTEAALREVASRAKARGTGARGLRAVLEKAMTDLLFELPMEGLEKVHFDGENIDAPLKALESKGLKKSA